MLPVLVIVIAYLLGSIPFGFLVVRATQGADIRDTGSGGTGATNVSRRAGKSAGVVTLLLDALKGAAAVLIAEWFNGVPFGSVNWWVAGAAVAVVLGHMFPVWLGFRGGKGVATGVGVFLVLAPLAVVMVGVIFLLVVWRTRYVSLASTLAAAAMPWIMFAESLVTTPRSDLGNVVTAAIVISFLIIYAHRANLERLVEGTESKFQ